MGCNMANRFLSLVLILYLSTFRLGKAEPDGCIGIDGVCNSSALADATCCDGSVCFTPIDTGTSKCSYCTSDSNLCGDGIADCCDGYFCTTLYTPNGCACMTYVSAACSTTKFCCKPYTCHDSKCAACIAQGHSCGTGIANCCEGYYCNGTLCTCGNIDAPCNDTNFCCEGVGLTCFNDSSGSGDVKCVACISSGNYCGADIADCCEGYYCDGSTRKCTCSKVGDACGTGSMNCCEDFTCVANGTGSTCSDCLKRNVRCDNSSDSMTCCLGLVCSEDFYNLSKYYCRPCGVFGAHCP